MLRDQRKNILQIPYVWAFTTYFAEGFPYTIIRIVSSVFFRDMHVSLQAIGLTSLFGLPLSLKFLWGPQVDQYGTKHHIKGESCVDGSVRIKLAESRELGSGVKRASIEEVRTYTARFEHELAETNGPNRNCEIEEFAVAVLHCCQDTRFKILMRL
jgi:hypothetical protein